MKLGFFIGFMLIDTILIVLIILTFRAERPVPAPTSEPPQNEIRWE